jgi:alpha-1,2-mannosyltransferase
LLVVAAAGLLVSPVSWSHHWVWIVPAVAVWACRGGRKVPLLLATTTLFLVGHRFLPHARGRELEWTWWQHVLGNSYPLAALAFLVVASGGVRFVATRPLAAGATVRSR